MENDLTGVKVGDILWHIIKGEVTVETVDTTRWPIDLTEESGGDCFMMDGRCSEEDVLPTLYWSRPDITIKKRPFSAGEIVNILKAAYANHAIASIDMGDHYLLNAIQVIIDHNG